MSPVPTAPSSPSAVHPSSEATEDPTVSQLFDLTGRTSVVTGGARGLGITLALALLEANSHVFCLDILPTPSQDQWTTLEKRAKTSGLQVVYKQVDITNPQALQTVMEEIEKEAKESVRVLVAAAGIQQEVPAISYPADDMRRMLDVNVVGTFNTAQAVAKVMLRHGKGGSIIMIASMSGSIANRGLQCTAYNTSKAAVQQLCRSVSAEWAGQGIRVNTISPGYIKTAMTEMLLQKKPELEARWADDNPMCRISLPWEYKGPTVFLASDASSFCTGMDLRVDGGHCAW